MPLFGTLDTISAADVLRILAAGGKAGILKVELGSVRKEIVLDSGRPVFCSSGSPREFVARNLLARTSVTECDIRDAVQLQESTGCLLGKALVDLGRITGAELDEVLHRKVEDSLLDVLTWKRGTFEFVEGTAPPACTPVRIATSSEAVIAAGERRAEEVERINRAVPDATIQFKACNERLAGRTPRCADEAAVLDFLARGLSPMETCQRLHAGDLEILGHVANLVEEGLLEPMRCGFVQPHPSVADTVERSTRLVRAGRSAEALAILREALSHDPRDQRVVAAVAGVEEGIRQRAEQSIGDPERVILRSVNFERLNAASLTPNEAYIASRLDGEWTVASVIRVCPFGELDALALVEGMFRRGLLMAVVAAAQETEPVLVGTGGSSPSRGAAPARTAQARSGGQNPPPKRVRDVEPGPGGR